MRVRSMVKPPFRAATWPSSEVPVPKGMTGILYSAQILTASATSSVDSAKNTPSGGTTG